jgi:hypothetical protein
MFFFFLLLLLLRLLLHLLRHLLLRDFRRGVPAPGELVIAIDFVSFSARN